ncbi:MAG: phosphate/phosphite/phosphonate ABC transporter substrate-binding protein [Planctomycetota bacterium]|nr:phosphate/phosphite/phosphonate ABC transporter substrate-binding protein [Planctomycetota bacterium]
MRIRKGRRFTTLWTAGLLAALLTAASCDSEGDNSPLNNKKEGGEAESQVDRKLPPLRIAFIPYENPERLIDKAEPALSFLQTELGRPIKAFVTLDYSAAVEALAAGHADVSFLSPLPYVLAHSRTGATAVLGEVYAGRPYYYSKIFVRKDSGIKTLADLRGKTIAYVDPISSSGYLYPHDILVRAGLIKDLDKPRGGFFKRVYFAGGDQQAIQAVYNEHVDAAGIGEFALNLLRLEDRDAITTIGESVRIPSHCVVVRKDLDKKLREQFIHAMLKLNEPANRKLISALYGTESYVEVTHETYKAVEQMAREYGFLK